MAIKRMTKDDLPHSLGAFKPVGHVLMAVRQDKLPDVLQALREAGFGDGDVLDFSAEEHAGRMEQMLDHSSDFAGFGYEIVLMRRYKQLADEGCEFLLVFAPEDEKTARVTEVAERFEVPSAVKYHRLVEEDLV
jgi:hypothetical protein